MIKLIVNADDLGIDKGINKGIELAHKNGIVTSTSIIAGGEYFDDAMEILRNNPLLDAGLHFTLVLSKPVAEPAKISSLLKDGFVFRDYWYNFYYALLTKKIKPDEIAIELEAQIHKLLDNGVKPSHLNSHLHLHLLPGVIERVLDAAKKYGIRWIRVPREPFSSRFNSKQLIAQKIKFSLYKIVTFNSAAKIKRAGFKIPDRCFGLTDTGCMNEYALLSCLERLEPDVNEILVHPGVSDGRKIIMGINNYGWDEELLALTSEKVKEYIKTKGIVLTNFRSI
jgi:chitin disaccharide deacetylase